MAEYGSGGSGGAGGTVNTGGMQNTLTYQTGGGIYESTVPVFQSAQALYALPQTLWNQGNYKEAVRLQKLAESAGFASFEEAINAAAQDPNKGSRSWEAYLTERSNDPFLQQYLKEKDGGSGSGDGPYSYSDTNTTVSGESNAASIIDQAFQSELGRMASDREIAAFQKALNQMQAQNPSSTVTSGTQSGNNRTSQTTNQQAFDPARFATEWAQSQPEYAETFAATNFMDLLDKVIADPNALDSVGG